MKKDLACYIVSLAIGAVIGWYVTSCWHALHPAECLVVRHKVEVDTVAYYKPVARDSVVVRYRTAMLPAIADAPARMDSGSMAAVEVPVTQKVYADSDYVAWVSGWEPSLDSIKVNRRTERVTVAAPMKAKPKRWHIGISAGYGYAPETGMSPYIGIGLTYSIKSF